MVKYASSSEFSSELHKNAARVLEALGNARRMRIIELIADSPRSAGELTRELRVSWPSVSRHLRILEDAGVIFRVDDVAARVLFFINDDAMDAAREWLKHATHRR